ncbi:MAG: RnfABCDGE type electron transport complex subunit D [Crocinitomicaceae bacterium]
MKAISLSLLYSFSKDARHFQILYLTAFLIFGFQFLHWDFSLRKIITILSSALITQLIWIYAQNGKLHSLKSGAITGLGLCLLLNSSSLLTLGLASSIAITAKYLLRYNGKHIFNPANFGIIISIVLFQDAWISPGQWGSNALFLFVLSVLGGIVLHKVGRLETSIVFLLTLFFLEYIRTVLYQGWEFEVLIHKFSSGTLLLFTFFMITDPMTIPNAKKARVIWSFVLAIATFICSVWIQLYTAPIWVLFFMAPITIWFDKILPNNKFKWNIN